MLRKLYILVLAALLAAALPAIAQSNKVKRQEAVIAELRRNIKEEEKTLRELKKNKASAQELVISLTKQIESRTALIEETSRQIKKLTAEVVATEKRINSLSTQLAQLEKNVTEIIREAYRNYRYQSHLTYIFSADSFADIARRIAMLRVATDFRYEQIKEVTKIRANVQKERDKLAKQREVLNETKRQLNIERKKLKADVASAKKSIEQMTSKEKSVLRSKTEHQKRLNDAIKELRKLVKGNKKGSSFVAGRKLQLPVENGKVVRYKENIAEISGAEGAAVTSVYEGRVFKVARNKVNNKYDVFIAHGEYITSYANLSEVMVENGDDVKKDQRIGTIGSMFDLRSEEIVYKIIFGIYSPNPREKIYAEVHFRK